MDTVENNKDFFQPSINDDFIVFHHNDGSIMYNVAIKPNEIIGIEENHAWGNKTYIIYGSKTTHVYETFDEVMNIIKEFKSVNSKKVLNEVNYGRE